MDRSNPLHPNFGKAIDPLILAADLTAAGYDVLYLDTNSTRLRHAEILRVNALDMSKLSGKGMRHYAITIAVNPEEFHAVNRIEYKMIASKQNIIINI